MSHPYEIQNTFVLINHLLGGYADPHGANPRISHSLTRSPLQYKDSAYVHVSDLSLTVIKLSYVKNVSSL